MLLKAPQGTNGIRKEHHVRALAQDATVLNHRPIPVKKHGGTKRVGL